MIYIGTSGFHYEHWENVFYPKNLSKSKWLEYYSQYFNSVELNVTFYRLVSENIFENWSKEVPESFIFAVKGSRYITHNKKLQDVEGSLKLFIERVRLLEDKLGIILWQFPKNFGFDGKKLENFLKILKKYKYRNAFEFRHESWFNEECYSIFRKYNCALVMADSPEFPAHEIITADYIYLRFHGGKILYGSQYSKKELDDWINKIDQWQKERDIFIYFNNDAHAFAVKNAQYLQKRIKKS